MMSSSVSQLEAVPQAERTLLACLLPLQNLVLTTPGVS
jgi:hypothetical protein